jgi:hypothetical protein
MAALFVRRRIVAASPTNCLLYSCNARLSLQNTPIDLQSLKLIDFHLLRWSAQQRLFTVLGALTSMLNTSAQLRLETSPCGNNSPSFVARLQNA